MCEIPAGRTLADDTSEIGATTLKIAQQAFRSIRLGLDSRGGAPHTTAQVRPGSRVPVCHR
jgi:hypothetical protein